MRGRGMPFGLEGLLLDVLNIGPCGSGRDCDKENNNTPEVDELEALITGLRSEVVHLREIVGRRQTEKDGLVGKLKTKEGEGEHYRNTITRLVQERNTLSREAVSYNNAIDAHATTIRGLQKHREKTGKISTLIGKLPNRPLKEDLSLLLNEITEVLNGEGEQGITIP